MQTKQDIRKYISKKRKELNETEVQMLSQQIVENIEQDAIFQTAQNILIYSPIQNEVDICSLVPKYPEKQFYLPVVIGNGEMEISPYSAHTKLQAGKFGILEPETSANHNSEIDLIICPGVAFDLEKNRLGRGGGYYDRYLASAQKCAIHAVAYDFQLLETILPHDAHDQKMQRIITPTKII